MRPGKLSMMFYLNGMGVRFSNIFEFYEFYLNHKLIENGETGSDFLNNYLSSSLIPWSRFTLKKNMTWKKAETENQASAAGGTCRRSELLFYKKTLYWYIYLLVHCKIEQFTLGARLQAAKYFFDPWPKKRESNSSLHDKRCWGSRKKRKKI